MSDAAKHDDIEDVLSSIRRLVADGQAAQEARAEESAPSDEASNGEEVAEKLILTAALRVTDPDEPFRPVMPTVSEELPEDADDAASFEADEAPESDESPAEEAPFTPVAEAENDPHAHLIAALGEAASFSPDAGSVVEFPSRGTDDSDEDGPESEAPEAHERQEFLTDDDPEDIPLESDGWTADAPANDDPASEDSGSEDPALEDAPEIEAAAEDDLGEAEDTPDAALQSVQEALQMADSVAFQFDKADAIELIEADDPAGLDDGVDAEPSPEVEQAESTDEMSAASEGADQEVPDAETAWPSSTDEAVFLEPEENAAPELDGADGVAEVAPAESAEVADVTDDETPAEAGDGDLDADEVYAAGAAEELVAPEADDTAPQEPESQEPEPQEAKTEGPEIAGFEPETGDEDWPSVDTAAAALSVAAARQARGALPEEGAAEADFSTGEDAFFVSRSRSSRISLAEPQQAEPATSAEASEETPDAAEPEALSPTKLATLLDEGFDADSDADDPEDEVFDEAALRELIRSVVHEELQGALGQRITRNVRKMVRREIRLALAADSLE